MLEVNDFLILILLDLLFQVVLELNQSIEVQSKILFYLHGFRFLVDVRLGDRKLHQKLQSLFKKYILNVILTISRPSVLLCLFEELNLQKTETDETRKDLVP